MTKYLLTKPGGPWDFPALGFSAVDGAILNGDLPTAGTFTTAPGPEWSVYGGGSAETGVTRYAPPSTAITYAPIPVPQGLVDAVIAAGGGASDAQIATRINTPGSATQNALATTYVRNILPPGSRQVRGMDKSTPLGITATVSTTTPASTTQITPLDSRIEVSGAPVYVDSRFTLTITASSGTYTITMPGIGTTAAIAFNAPASTIAAAIQGALPSATYQATVTGSGPFTVDINGPTRISTSTPTSTGATVSSYTGQFIYARRAQRTTLAYGTTDHAVQFAVLVDDASPTLRLTPLSTTRLQAFVDGVRVWSAPQRVVTDLGATNGSTNYVSLPLGSRQLREIIWEVTSDVSQSVNFGGIHIAANVGTCLPPVIRSRRLVLAGGDSYSSVGMTSAGYAYSRKLARRLGIRAAFTFAAVPSTGTTKADATASMGTYSSRFAFDVIPLIRAYDLVVLQASVNDGSATAGAVQTQMTADLQTLQAAQPLAQIVVTSPLFIGTPTAGQLRVNTEAKAAADACGVPYVDVLTAGLFTGTGWIGKTTPALDGNADNYATPTPDNTNSQGSHPSDDAADMIAAFLAPKIEAAYPFLWAA